MLLVVFELGADRYAIDVSQVLEVLPLVDLRKLPQSPSGVAGVFNFRGTPVPVIDLTQLALGRPSEPRLSTRVIIVRDSSLGAEHVFGVIAERATATIRRAATEFVWPVVTSDRAQYLGPVAPDERGLLQLIDGGQLLSASVREVLFRPPAVSPCP